MLVFATLRRWREYLPLWTPEAAVVLHEVQIHSRLLDGIGNLRDGDLIDSASLLLSCAGRRTSGWA